VLPAKAITVERTFDFALVKSYITHPRVYGHVSDDSCVPADRFEPCQLDAVIYALIKFDGEPVGVFMFVTENAVTAQVHTCLSPDAWGRSAEAARAAAAWLFASTQFLRINTQIPVCNKLAERLAQKAGMTQYGLCPKSFLKGGRVWDIALYGMSKEH
jgi:RimJ/RimL family protein N-acetyltransferase